MTLLVDIDSLLGTICRPIGISFASAVIPNAADEKRVSRLVRDCFTAIELVDFEKIRSIKRRHEFFAGRMAAKKVLASKPFCLLGSSSQIRKEDNGAPKIVHRPDLHLSISHSGNVAVAAVWRSPLGIDVELNDSRPDSLVKYFFSTRELSTLEQLEKSERQRQVNTLWTRKEAVAKVGGWGGRLPFNKLDCSRAHAHVDDRHIHLHSTSRGRYVASIAYEYEDCHG